MVSLLCFFQWRSFFSLPLKYMLAYFLPQRFSPTCIFFPSFFLYLHHVFIDVRGSYFLLPQFVHSEIQMKPLTKFTYIMSTSNCSKSCLKKWFEFGNVKKRKQCASNQEKGSLLEMLDISNKAFTSMQLLKHNIRGLLMYINGSNYKVSTDLNHLWKHVKKLKLWWR